MPREPIGHELIRRHQHLPHWQLGGSTYFLTFCSARGELPPAARAQTLTHILHDHQRRYDLHIAVVMPDHVHLLLTPRSIGPGQWHNLSDILKTLKGVSSRRINQLLATQDSVWQDETFDRIVRDEKEYLQKWEYIWTNPVRSGLVERSEDYPYLLVGANASL